MHADIDLDFGNRNQILELIDYTQPTLEDGTSISRVFT